MIADPLVEAARRAAKYIPDGGGWGVHFSIPDASHVVAQHGLDERQGHAHGQHPLFRGFLDDNRLALGWSMRVEEKFSYPLNPLVNITGRIDRLDIGPENQALVIDYKYSAGNKIRERVDDSSAGHAVQGGLYLAA